LRIDNVTYDDIEEMAQRIGEETKREIEDETARAQGTGYVGTRMDCPSCGSRSRYRGQRLRQVISLSGGHMIARSYYHCDSCRLGWCNLDTQLALPSSGEGTRKVRALSARFASYLPFRLAAQELSQICGVELSTTAVQRYARQIGESVKSEWDEQTELVARRKAKPSTELPSKLEVTMDGVFVFIDGDWREVKVGAAYPLDADAKALTESARYYATTARSHVFGKRMQALVHQSGGDRCGKIGTVGDGADWIWMEVGKFWPRSVQALDFFHLSEHLWAVAKLRFGESSSAAAGWVEEQQSALLDDKACKVAASIQEWKPRRPDKREAKRKLIAYIETHKNRVRYKSISQAGYQIGSGVVEAANKSIVQARMKRAGMRWSEQGADVMLHLCAARHSKGFEGFVRYAA
jgi:hypothetical protein